MSPKRNVVTKPKQAASKSTLDKWQRAAKAIIAETEASDCAVCLRTTALAKTLLASMERSERR